MAVFGLPGGAEWLVIGVTALLLFVPSIGFLALGYLLGRRSAARVERAPAPGGVASSSPEKRAAALRDDAEAPAHDDASSPEGSDG